MAPRNVAMASSADTDARAGIAVAVLAVLVFMQTHFLAERIEESVTWSYGATLVPLWIMNAMLALYLVFQLLFGASLWADDDEEYLAARDSKITHFSALIVLSMFFASEVMAAQRLDGVIERTMFEIFGPLYAASAFILLFGASIWYFNYAAANAARSYV